MPSEQNAAMYDNLAARFRKLYDPARALGESIATRQAITGIVGLWAGCFTGGGTVQTWADISGADNHLGINGNPVARLLGTGRLTPSMKLDGTGDYWNIAHNNTLSILGNESYIAVTDRGLTVLCWVRFTTLATNVAYVTKAQALSGTSTTSNYSLLKGSSDNGRFKVWEDTTGTEFDSGSAGGPGAVDTWYFSAGRYVPSTSVDHYWGSGGVLDKSSNTTSIPSLLVNATTTDFAVGGLHGGSSLLNGYVALPTVFEIALEDHHIEMLYHMDRPVFSD